jgi:hypothetical protein
MREANKDMLDMPQSDLDHILCIQRSILNDSVIIIRDHRLFVSLWFIAISRKVHLGYRETIS